MNSHEILKEMTLEEKAGLCSGLDSWQTKPVERLGVPSVWMSDGPHGLRMVVDQGGESQTLRSVCFPTGAALAASFDRELLGDVGRTVGEEALAAGAHAVLGPAVNMKRSPLCGRNFEYLSEDPLLAGELGAAYVKGMQGAGVSACVKHYAANNQEKNRMSVSSDADERTLREIYLSAFERIVKAANPWSIMCSYNRINGVYSCENPWLLTELLRDSWGFKGIVMTDWGAMNDRVKAIQAGLNLEMPSSHGENDKRIVEAVKAGLLDESELDKMVLGILDWVEKISKPEADRRALEARLERDHAFARQIAQECAVLLKNEGDILPLSKEANVLFVGGFAESPRFQGGGSSHINSSHVVSALKAASGFKNVSYAKGFAADQDCEDADLAREAISKAAAADAVVVFAGLPDAFESEGYDREHLDMPNCQNALIEAIAKVQPNTVVVLHNGSPVLMPWLDNVRGVLEMYLGGEAVGEAAVSLLFGDANPCGKLAETFPLRLEDTPCYLDYPGTMANGRYSEGVFIGYRWYESRKMPVLFPFGHGLSYTKFILSGMRLSGALVDEENCVTISVDVENAGERYGKEVVQLYVAPPGGGEIKRPAIELKGFEKAGLKPGEKKRVDFALDLSAFSCFDPRIKDWYAQPGEYTVLIGTSSRDLPLRATVEVKTRVKPPLEITDTTTCGDILEHMGMTRALKALITRTTLLEDSAEDNPDIPGKQHSRMFEEILWSLPLHSLTSFGDITYDEIQAFIASARKEMKQI